MGCADDSGFITTAIDVVNGTNLASFVCRDIYRVGIAVNTTSIVYSFVIAIE